MTFDQQFLVLYDETEELINTTFLLWWHLVVLQLENQILVNIMWFYVFIKIELNENIINWIVSLQNGFLYVHVTFWWCLAVLTIIELWFLPLLISLWWGISVLILKVFGIKLFRINVEILIKYSFWLLWFIDKGILDNLVFDLSIYMVEHDVFSVFEFHDAKEFSEIQLLLFVIKFLNFRHHFLNLIIFCLWLCFRNRIFLNTILKRLDRGVFLSFASFCFPHIFWCFGNLLLFTFVFLITAIFLIFPIFAFWRIIRFWSQR